MTKQLTEQRSERNNSYYDAFRETTQFGPSTQNVRQTFVMTTKLKFLVSVEISFIYGHIEKDKRIFSSHSRQHEKKNT